MFVKSMKSKDKLGIPGKSGGTGHSIVHLPSIPAARHAIVMGENGKHDTIARPLLNIGFVIIGMLRYSQAAT